MKIYMSGRITGDPSYQAKFEHWEGVIAATHRDTVIVNPAVLPAGLDRDAYLPVCLPLLNACDAIFLPPDWMDSKGAKLEKAYAEYQGKTVLYANT